ncbi:MAG: PLP-dependent transferase [Verrucomicrobiota bacterium]
MSDLSQPTHHRPEDLGKPLPDSPHACSVTLPTWESIIGYEEKDPQVFNQLQTGYPRFVLHPIVAQLCSRVEAELGQPGERALLFPCEEAASRAGHFVLHQNADAVVWISPTDYQDCHALLVQEQDFPHAFRYWQHTGEILSSRQAESYLEGKAPEKSATENQKSKIIRNRLAQLYGVPADHIFLTSGGMASLFLALRAVTALHPGQETLHLEFPYVDLLKIQEQFSPGVRFYPCATGSALEHALEWIESDTPPAAIFAEVPSNPLLRTLDLTDLQSRIAYRKSPLILDDTLTSVANLSLLPHADLVSTSLTKWFSGGGDVLAGSLIVNPASPHADFFREFFANDSATPLHPLDAEVLEKNSRDFLERMHRANESGQALAHFLRTHPAVEEVYYPDQSPSYQELMQPKGGFGGLLSFVLKDPQKTTPRFYDEIAWCKGPSLGTNFSLLSPYTQLAHYRELEWAEFCGVSRHLLRLSVGQEPQALLLQRLEEALSSLNTAN